MATLGRVVVDLVARTAKFETGLKKARRVMNSFKAETQLISSGMKQFGMVAAGAVAGLGYMVKRVVDVGDDLDKMSKRTGMSVKFLGDLSLTANLLGTDLYALEMPIRQMTDAVGRDDKIFQKLGVTLKGTDGKFRSLESIFWDTAEALANETDVTKRATLAMDAFGTRGGTTVLAMMSDGIEAFKESIAIGQKYNKYTDSAVQKMVILKDQFTILKAAVGGIAVDFVSKLMPVLTKLVDKFLAWYDANEQVIGSKIAAYAEQVGSAIWWIGTGLAKAVDWLVKFTNEHPTLAKMAAGFAMIHFMGIDKIVVGLMSITLKLLPLMAANMGIVLGIANSLSAACLLIGVWIAGWKLGKLLGDLIHMQEIIQWIGRKLNIKGFAEAEGVAKKGFEKINIEGMSEKAKARYWATTGQIKPMGSAPTPGTLPQKTDNETRLMEEQNKILEAIRGNTKINIAVAG